MTTWTNRGAARALAGTLELGVLEAALLTISVNSSARLWNTDADLVAELTTAEVANYARAAITGATVVEDDVAAEAVIDFADTSFGALVAPATGDRVAAVAVIDTVTSDVIWCANLVTLQETNAQPFVIQWADAGAAAARHAA